MNDIIGEAETPMSDHIDRFWQLLETNHVRILIDMRRDASSVSYWDSSSFGDDVAKALVAQRAALSHQSGEGRARKLMGARTPLTGTALIDWLTYQSGWITREVPHIEISERSHRFHDTVDEIKRLNGALSAAADYLEAGFKNRLDPEAFGKALEVIGDALRPFSSHNETKT